MALQKWDLSFPILWWTQNMSKEEDRTWQDRRPYLLGLLEIKVTRCVQVPPYPQTCSSRRKASEQAALEDRNQTVRPRNHVMSQLKKDRGSGEAQHDNYYLLWEVIICQRLVLLLISSEGQRRTTCSQLRQTVSVQQRASWGSGHSPKCSNREARKGIPIAGEKLECISPKTFVWKLQADDLHVIRGKQMARALISRRCAFGEFCCCYWRQSWVDVPLSMGLMFFSSPWPAPLPTHPVPQPRVHWHLLLCLHCRVFPLYSTHLTHVCYYLPFLCRWVIKWLQLCSMNSQPSSETVA